MTRREFAATIAASATMPLPAAAAAASPAPPKSAEPAKYPIYRARGNHRALGQQHGEQAADHIRRHLDVMCAGHKITRVELRRRALLFEAMFQRHCPHLLEELRGLAEGARIELADAMACNIRGLPEKAGGEGCTAFAITARGTDGLGVLAGQNSDMDDNVPPMAYVLHLAPAGKPEVLMWTFGGMIGYHGMNSAGVAHFANALGGGPASRFAMPHYPVKRMMLECSTVAQATELLRKIPLGSNGNYVLCDGAGRISDVEATTAGPEVIGDSGAGFLAHTNHFLCSRYARKENFEQSWPDSFPRVERMNALIQATFGKITVAGMQAFLRDHNGQPTAICRHDGASRTVASLIAEPKLRRMHVAAGHPCRTDYVTYSM